MEEYPGMSPVGAYLYCHVGYLTIRRTVKQFPWIESKYFLYLQPPFIIESDCTNVSNGLEPLPRT